MQIDVDFDVWKALTARREAEAVSYNDVLREMLGLAKRKAVNTRTAGYSAGGRHLPNGTELKAEYKGTVYLAGIENGKILSAGGKSFGSLSAAARDITGNNVNGLRFWRAKRPGDDQWLLVAGLPAAHQ